MLIKMDMKLLCDSGVLFYVGKWHCGHLLYNLAASQSLRDMILPFAYMRLFIFCSWWILERRGQRSAFFLPGRWVCFLLIVVVNLAVSMQLNASTQSVQFFSLYAEFHWRYLASIRRSCQRAIYVSISYEVLFDHSYDMDVFWHLCFFFLFFQFFYRGEDGVSGVLLHHKQVIILCS